MKMIAMLCGLVDDQSHKIIALSPESNHWFVNVEDATPEYKEMAAETELDGKVSVLGFLFGPGGLAE